jgi:excisionase family DNA binding protein
MTRKLVPLQDVPTHRSWTTVRLLRRYVAERRIPFHKVGARVLIDLDDLDAYAEAGRHEAGWATLTLPEDDEGRASKRRRP